MIGTPKNGVTTFSGISVPSGGSEQSQLHASPVMAPKSSVRGHECSVVGSVAYHASDVRHGKTYEGNGTAKGSYSGRN